jgi:uncharacterized protein YidB (DUF937 family)
MGLLDSLLGTLGDAQGEARGGGNAALLNAVVGMLGQDGSMGGLAGLVEKFQRGGLGDVVGSWVGTGQNLPVSPEQLRGALGDDVVGGLAEQAGVAQHGDLLGPLSQLLPQLVDKLTPNGHVPQGEATADLGSMLGGLLRR